MKKWGENAFYWPEQAILYKVGTYFKIWGRISEKGFLNSQTITREILIILIYFIFCEFHFIFHSLQHIKNYF